MTIRTDDVSVELAHKKAKLDARIARRQARLDGRMVRRRSQPQGQGVDSALVHWIGLGLCGAGIIGGGTASVEGLWHAASWFEEPHMQWTLAVAVDPFLAGLAVLGVVFRKRKQKFASFLAAVATLSLVAFSAWANYHYQTSIAIPGTDAAQYGPIIKATMPVLLLLGIEFAAALFSSRGVAQEAVTKERAEVPVAKVAEVAMAPRVIVEAAAVAAPTATFRRPEALETAPKEHVPETPSVEVWIRQVIADERRVPTGQEIGDKAGKSARSGQRILNAMRQRDPEINAAVEALAV